mmetsp:Transcript_65120/g.121365  ORF Transcript_65120/g.121365 Transcript_65120/m.121365 type:complete len:452 (-) Transcript_65120:277-1632(-)
MAAAGIVNAFGEDWCVACQESLADVILACNHRVYCSECFKTVCDKARNRGRLPRCPWCRQELRLDLGEVARACRELQLTATTTEDAGPVDGRHPFERLLHFQPAADETGRVDAETMQRIREAVRAVQRRNLSHQQVMDALQDHLSDEERDYAMIELKKDVNLHSTLLVLDMNYWQRSQTWEMFARSLVRHLAEADDKKAVALRAGLSAGAQTIELAVCGGSFVTTCGFCVNLAVFLMLASIDVYRWSKGDLSSTALGVKLGEHSCGCGLAFAGAAGGAALGGILGPVGAALGALLGSFIGDFTGRSAWQYRCAKMSQREIEDCKVKASQDAARNLGIDLHADNYAVAKAKFRAQILSTHPDRNPEVAAEDAAALIAHWQIVRAHYASSATSDEEDAPHAEADVAIYLTIMKVRSNINDGWKIVRSWFGNARNAAPDQETQLEKIEQQTLFI